MRSIGEMLYLLMIIGTFTIFSLALAWVERTWQPKDRAHADRGVPPAAE